MNILRSHVPKCMLTSLELVEILGSNENYLVETELVEYLSRNAAVLREFAICFHCRAAEDKYQVVKQINTFTRRSSACQVFVH